MTNTTVRNWVQVKVNHNFPTPKQKQKQVDFVRKNHWFHVKCVCVCRCRWRHQFIMWDGWHEHRRFLWMGFLMQVSRQRMHPRFFFWAYSCGKVWLFIWSNASVQKEHVSILFSSILTLRNTQYPRNDTSIPWNANTYVKMTSVVVLFFVLNDRWQTLNLNKKSA